MELDIEVDINNTDEGVRQILSQIRPGWDISKVKYKVGIHEESIKVLSKPKKMLYAAKI